MCSRPPEQPHSEHSARNDSEHHNVLAPGVAGATSTHHSNIKLE